MSNMSYYMRREKDIELAVKKHFRDVKDAVNACPPTHIYMQTLVYWPQKAKKIIESFDIPEFDLAATIEGRNWMKDKLWEYGQKVAAADRPDGLASDVAPLGISIAVQTIIPDSLTPINEENKEDIRQKFDNDVVFHEGDHLAEGPPVLLMAGRLATGKHVIKLEPIARTVKLPRRCMLGVPAPAEHLKRIEEIRLKGVDFMLPFFEGFHSGQKPEKPFSVIQ